MANDPERRLGWGEPVDLAGTQADDVRTLLASYCPPTGTEAHYARRRLLAKFIPPVELCASARREIQASANYLNNLESSPDERDPDYDEAMGHLSGLLVGMREQFESRPNGCEMIADAEGETFECERCNFYCSVRDY